MMWAGITSDGRTALVYIPPLGMTADWYVAEILEPHVVLFIEGAGRDITLQQDNARPHVARVTLEYLHAMGIEILEWSANSSDLNVIEHLWDELIRRVQKRPRQPQTLQELREALLEEWDNIPQDVIRKLVESMRDRCEVVIAANGRVTLF